MFSRDSWGLQPIKIPTKKRDFFRGGPTLGSGYIPFSSPPPSPGSKKRSLRCVKSEPSRDLKMKTADMGIEGSYDRGLSKGNQWLNKPAKNVAGYFLKGVGIRSTHRSSDSV